MKGIFYNIHEEYSFQKTANILSINIEKYGKYAKILAYGRKGITICNIL